MCAFDGRRAGSEPGWGRACLCVALRFLGKKTLAKFMDVSRPLLGEKCIVNGKKVLCATGDTKRTLIL